MIKRHYFAAGNTPIRDGENKQFDISFSVTSFFRQDPEKVKQQLREDYAKKLGVDKSQILLTAFNRV